MTKMKDLPIRKALRVAFNKLAMARDTGNRELQANAYGFIREYWPKRHQNLNVIFQPR